MYTYKIFNNIADDGINILQNNELRVDEINPDALLIRSQVLSDADLNNSLKCIGRAGAGTNNVPVQDATSKGIVVFNTPGANANAVKELVVCGMLLSSRGIIEGNAYSKTLSGQETPELNKSMEAQKKIFKGSELKGKTLGIVGLGAIGSLLAQTAEVMGMKIIGYDPHISVDAAWRLPQDVEKAESLEFLLANSDYISLHVPLIEATKDLISKDMLRHFKKGAKLINLSRGGIVNNTDIIEALNSKQISTFGASTKEAEVNCAVMAANQVANFLKNGVIINSVNFPSIKLGRATENRLVIINKNEPGMIGRIADKIASSNLNITDMTNKSRDTIAINLIDLEDKPSEQLIDDILKIDHVLSVRLCG
jgi:D-3-phosphoglycerate dehydrogenase